QRSELVTHGSYALGRDALHRSPPAGMESADNPALLVGQQYGQAVGSEDGNRDSGNIRDQSIAGLHGAAGRAQNVNDVRMNLPSRKRGRGRGAVGGAERQQKQPPVLFDVFSRIFFGEAEVERSTLVTSGDAARTSAESMHEPRDPAEVRRPQYL